MNPPARGSRVVFVGNIPFELTEEQLIDIFKEVGPVASFRLLFDRETGRPKGYGFCEFYDAETAASAVRNLNDYDIGGRQIRVDYAAMDPHLDNQRHHKQQQQQQPPPAARSAPPPAPQAPPQAPPPMMVPPAMAKAPGSGTSVDDISKVLASMSSQDLYTLMTHMKVRFWGGFVCRLCETENEGCGWIKANVLRSSCVHAGVSGNQSTGCLCVVPSHGHDEYCGSKHYHENHEHRCFTISRASTCATAAHASTTTTTTTTTTTAGTDADPDAHDGWGSSRRRRCKGAAKGVVDASVAADGRTDQCAGTGTSRPNKATEGATDAAAKIAHNKIYPNCSYAHVCVIRAYSVL